MSNFIQSDWVKTIWKILGIIVMLISLLKVIWGVILWNLPEGLLKFQVVQGFDSATSLN
jgi:hypothetical protein